MSIYIFSLSDISFSWNFGVMAIVPILIVVPGIDIHGGEERLRAKVADDRGKYFLVKDQFFNPEQGLRCWNTWFTISDIQGFNLFKSFS